MDEKQIEISTPEMRDFLFKKLINVGYAPSEEELAELADIFFNFLVDKGIMSEVDYE